MAAATGGAHGAYSGFFNPLFPPKDCLPEPEPEPEPEPSINPNYHSVGSCYTHGADPSVTCNIAAADCEAGGGSPYDPGYISGTFSSAPPAPPILPP